MTTDITELAQSLKAAAEKATPGRWEYYPGNTSIEYNVDSMDEGQGSIVYVDSGDFTQAQTDRNGEFIALANPANILALVEALEKAQRYIEELREWNAGLAQESHEYQQRIAELEPIRAAAERLVRCKGRYHSELNYRALATLFGVNNPDLPPLDGESRTVTAAAADVLAERKRQVSVEGWTPSHDDTHKNNEMAFAASCYAFHAAAATWDLEDDGIPYDSHPVPKQWPWDPSWWKPTDARRDLVKAGALILAEIERIDRADGIKLEAE
ncbi:ead/Ea22-like family protein [Raoultella ornithinolytica]|uniref:Ead/Ea22-like family protein n=1 Tax=Raoultella ornithinolytica TaxID=54291 RepID=A0A9Q9N0M2_RAOOR|nr:ead/Ea22-like family protein [Raoultella ornithinolytica]UXE40646.1 ead/Ea22-like family protein [Raoultella ornithinolytica]